MKPEEDEAFVERSRAPLLEHLTELRGRLFICLAALAIGFAVSFAFAGQIAKFLLEPWNIAVGLIELQKQQGHSSPFNLDMLKGVLGLIELPPPPAVATDHLITTKILESFIVKVKLAAFGAIGITFPVLAWQLYRFVAPGLYKKERLTFAPFLIAAPVLFLMGAAMAYKIVLPFVNWFGLNQNKLGDITITATPTISEYVKSSTTFILAFGICFQLPVVLSLAALSGLLTSKQLATFRRLAIVIVFVIAAIFTPPDPISQISLAVPLVLLYEVSIWVVKLLELRRRKADEAAEAAS